MKIPIGLQGEAMMVAVCTENEKIVIFIEFVKNNTNLS
jgi:hypothetical protein